MVWGMNNKGNGSLGRTVQAVALIALMLVASTAFGRDRMSRDLQGKKQSDTVEVIIRYAKAPQADHADRVRQHGGMWKRQFSAINGAAVTIRRDKLEKLLQKDPDLSYVALDRPLMSSAKVENSTVGAYVAAQSYGLDGTGVGVAVIDSGVADSPDLNSVTGASRVVYSESFVSSDPNNAKDVFGHGTHVTGILGGNGAGSYGKYAGVAPGVKIIDLRVLDANGGGKDSDVIAAINRAIQLKAQYNIRVINLSIGRPVFESYQDDPLCQATEAAWKAGIVVVVAAGNDGRNNTAGTDGYATINSPANDPYVITVGATKTNGNESRWDDVVASYSSKGPSAVDHVVKPDLVAPGNNVISIKGGSTLGNLQPSNVLTGSAGGKYFKMSGTSMATPMVAGAAAILLQREPALTPDQVKARLMKSAWKGLPTVAYVLDLLNRNHAVQGDIFTVGSGYLDIAAALGTYDLAPATVGSAISPTAVKDPVTGNVKLVGANGSVLGGNGLVWGTGIVWGTVNVSADGLVWGTGIVWGTAGVNADGLVWGTGIVWGTLDPSGQGLVWGTDTSDVPDVDDQPIQ